MSAPRRRRILPITATNVADAAAAADNVSWSRDVIIVVINTSARSLAFQSRTDSVCVFAFMRDKATHRALD